MDFDSIKRRLGTIEGKRSRSDVTAYFQDGSARRLVIRDGLGLLLDQFAREHAICTGEPYGKNEFDETSGLLARAERVATDDPLIVLAHGLASGRHSNEEASNDE